MTFTLSTVPWRNWNLNMYSTAFSRIPLFVPYLGGIEILVQLVNFNFITRLYRTLEELEWACKRNKMDGWRRFVPYLWGMENDHEAVKEWYNFSIWNVYLRPVWLFFVIIFTRCLWYCRHLSMLLNSYNLHHYFMILYLISDFSHFSVDNLFAFFTITRIPACFLTFVKTDCTLAYFLDFRQFFW